MKSTFEVEIFHCIGNLVHKSIILPCFHIHVSGLEFFITRDATKQLEEYVTKHYFVSLCSFVASYAM